LRKLIASLAAVLALSAAAVAPVGAITGTNYTEDFDHPFVGLAVFYTIEDGQEVFSHRCSGSLLSPTVFLTAGHCTDGVDTARIYFQQDAGAHYDPATQLDPVSGYPDFCAAGTLGVTCATSDELYNFGFDNFAGFPNIRDAGLVILDQPISLGEYGILPEIGTMDVFANRVGQFDRTVRISGYGVTYRDASGQHDISFRIRLQGTSKVTNVVGGNTGGFNLQSSGNGGGRSGTCGGDSGGPVFYPEDTNVIVAVTSFGLNAWCRGQDFAFRVDTQAVQDWMRSVLSPQEWAGLQFAG
jgi:trypsin